MLKKAVTQNKKRKVISYSSDDIPSKKSNKNPPKTKKKSEPLNKKRISEEQKRRDLKKRLQKTSKTKTTLETRFSGYQEETYTGIPSSRLNSPDIEIGLDSQNRSIRSETESSSTYTESSSSSESASNSSDTDSDILTPEEAFQLPPGSLSLYPHVVANNGSRQRLNDDDDDTGLLGHRTCNGLLPDDEEDNELMRCSGGGASSSNFTMADMDRMMMLDNDHRHHHRRGQDSEHGRTGEEGGGGSDGTGMLLDHRNLSSPSNLMMNHHDFSDEFDQALFGTCSATALSPSSEVAPSPLSCPSSSGVLSPNSTTVPVFKSPLKLCQSPLAPSAVGMFNTSSISSLTLSRTATASSISCTVANDKINNQPNLKINNLSQSIRTGYSSSSSRTRGITGSAGGGGSTTLKITPVMRPLSRVVAHVKEQNDVNSQQSISCPPPPLLATKMSSSINKPPLIGSSSSCGGISIPPTFTAAAQVKIIPSYTLADKDVISNNDNNILDKSNNNEHLFTISSSTTDVGSNNQSSINNIKVHINPCSSHQQKNVHKTKSSDSVIRSSDTMLDLADHHSLTTSAGDVFSSLSSSSRILQNHHQSDDKTSTQISTGTTNVDIMNDLSSSAAPLDISGGYDGDGGCDEETPLEKVNPDIFFSSAFPVTSNPDI